MRNTRRDITALSRCALALVFASTAACTLGPFPARYDRDAASADTPRVDTAVPGVDAGASDAGASDARTDAGASDAGIAQRGIVFVNDMGFADPTTQSAVVFGAAFGARVELAGDWCNSVTSVGICKAYRDCGPRPSGTVAPHAGAITVNYDVGRTLNRDPNGLYPPILASTPPWRVNQLINARTNIPSGGVVPAFDLRVTVPNQFYISEPPIMQGNILPVRRTASLNVTWLLSGAAITDPTERVDVAFVAKDMVAPLRALVCSDLSSARGMSVPVTTMQLLPLGQMLLRVTTHRESSVRLSNWTIRLESNRLNIGQDGTTPSSTTAVISD